MAEIELLILELTRQFQMVDGLDTFEKPTKTTGVSSNEIVI
jgi:hypothetical protein